MTAPTLTEKRHATDTAYRAVNYIETYTGKMFFSLNPKVDDVNIFDIAHHLANQCRYSGATQKFYSTAQHCCLLAHYAETIMKADAIECMLILMHDAAEAYLVDIPRPVKQHMLEYRAWDAAIQKVVRTWLGLGDVPLPSYQDEIDSRIIVDERAQLMSDSGNDWHHSMEPLGLRIVPWISENAENQFLYRYATYARAIFGEHVFYRENWGIDGEAASKFRVRYRKDFTDDPVTAGVIEVDLRGNVGKVKLVSENGMLIRDTEAGKFPAPAWRWVHGQFEILRDK
jgi:hypothetical protein